MTRLLTLIVTWCVVGGIGPASAAEQQFRVGATLGPPVVLGLDAEFAQGFGELGRFALAPVAQFTYVAPPEKWIGTQLSFVALHAGIRGYFDPSATGFFAATGVSAFGAKFDATPAGGSNAGAGRAWTIPLSVWWRGIWGHFTNLVELGVEIPLLVDATYVDRRSRELYELSRIPFIRVVPRLGFSLGGAW